MPFLHRQHFDRAKELIAKGDDDSLRYAAQELRFCIEEIVYDKARAYAHSLSRKDLGTWHPRTLMRILEECDPNAGEGYVLAFRTERSDDPARVIGKHQALPQKVLNDHYTKLGKYVHAPPPDGSPRPAATQIREFLETVVRRIEPAALNTLQCGLVETASLECLRCQKVVARSVHELRKKPVLQCHHEGCGAIYDWKEIDGQSEFKIRRVTAKCHGCGIDFLFDEHLLEDGVTVSCCGCRKRYLINRPWTYSPLTDRAAAQTKTGAADRADEIAGPSELQ